MTSPIDTLREALTTEGPYLARLDAALAALTQVEHQLAAWEKAGYAESETVAAVLARAVAAERRANALADALREHQWNAYTFVGMRPCIACGNEEKEGHQPGCPVGAALDRQEQT